jgi:demethylspheroidene O-methyltransferase
VPSERLAPLLDAAVSLGLVERRGGGRLGLGTLGAALLGNPGVEAMIRHHSMLYADLADAAGFFRGAVPGRELRAFWGYSTAADPARLESGELSAYTQLMSASQQFVADLVLAAYPFRRHRRLLELGGGDGTFAQAAAQHVPSLQVELVDLPAVAPRAAERFRQAGLAARAKAHGANLFAGPLPRGADLVTLVRVVHDHDDHKVRQLLLAARAAIAPGGTLLIAEPMSGAGSADAYLGVYLLAMGSGRTRSAQELGRMMTEAGFVRVRRRRTHNPLLASVITAEAPRTP